MKNLICSVLLFTVGCGTQTDGEEILSILYCNEDLEQNKIKDDADCDGVITSEDCNDYDATVVNTNIDDTDCDGVIASEDCDDNDATVVDINTDDVDCDGVEVVVEYKFHPNEFTFYVEQTIIDQNVVNHSSWQNQITIVLFERNDMEGHPRLDMESCLLFLKFDGVEENEPNAQSFFGYDIESFEVSHDTSLQSQCSEMNPNHLNAYKEAAENAQWSVGIGDITNSIHVEYDSWLTQNEHELLEIEKDSNYSNVHNFISTIYIRSDWSGSMVTLAPGVTLSYQSNGGGTINENMLHVLHGITEPPDGLYFSRALFSFSLFDIVQ